MNTYPQHPMRKSQNLDGVWDFKFISTTTPIDQMDFRQIAYDDVMTVPGAFDAGPKYAGKRGLGVYRRKLVTGEGASKLRLKINGLGFQARVFWDGREIAATKLAYTPLTVDFDAGETQSHEMIVATDNRFEKGSALLLYPNYDFYCYGGIYRNVELEWLPCARIERAKVSVSHLERGEVSIELLLGGTAAKASSCKVSFDGAQSEEVKIKPKNGLATFKALVPNPKTWSPETPNLHTVRISIDGDEIIERFGLRTIKAEKGRILLNGKAIKLRGVCRHEAHPQFGPAIPDALQLEDIQFLKDMNCNFVRCVHYPQSQSFFDLCDSVGILVWTESLGWGDNAERLVTPAFGDLQERQTRQMVRDAINHPSVIIWAFLNEGESQKEESKPLYKRLIDAIREEDPTRLVSYASCRDVNDVNYQLADIVSMNIYPAWLSDVGWEKTTNFDAIGQHVDRLAKFCERPDLKNKPFIMSEIGACGLLGCRDRLRAAWSEEFQSDYFGEAIKCIFGSPRMSGISLWQMYDTRTFPNGDVRCKARAFNNAGVLDEYRRPKLAYDTVKESFKAIAEAEHNG